MELGKPKKEKKEKGAAEKILVSAEKSAKKPVKEEKGKEGKKAHGMHIHAMKSGGYHIQHTDENKMPIPGEEHAAPDLDALHDHLEEHLQGAEPNDGEEMTQPNLAPNATTSNGL